MRYLRNLGCLDGDGADFETGIGARGRRRDGFSTLSYREGRPRYQSRVVALTPKSAQARASQESKNQETLLKTGVGEENFPLRYSVAFRIR